MNEAWYLGDRYGEKDEGLFAWLDLFVYGGKKGVVRVLGHGVHAITSDDQGISG